MKKILVLVTVIFLVGCSSASSADLAVALAENETLTLQLEAKERDLDDLENQVQVLNDSLDTLQDGYDELKAMSNGAETAAGDSGGKFLCDEQLDYMKYENTFNATAIIDGWFAQQPQARVIQGTYATAFWTGVKSTIHTIRYISNETGLTTTSTFMIFFEEEGWQPGLLWMTEQCWLDYPG